MENKWRTGDIYLLARHQVNVSKVLNKKGRKRTDRWTRETDRPATAATTTSPTVALALATSGLMTTTSTHQHQATHPPTHPPAQAEEKHRTKTLDKTSKATGTHRPPPHHPLRNPTSPIESRYTGTAAAKKRWRLARNWNHIVSTSRWRRSVEVS